MQRKHFLLYGHGGAYNHGGEAITRCTIELLRKLVPDCFISLSTHFPEQDAQFGLQPDEFISRNMSASNNRDMYLDTLRKISPETTVIQVGGDNYCYTNWQRYAQIHQEAKKRGGRSVLWGCSIDETAIDDELLTVLGQHDLILAREGITFQVLKNKGLTNVLKVSDIAFGLKSIQSNIVRKHYVVVNISPLICRRSEDVLDAVRQLVAVILTETDYDVVLLPHVRMPADDDLDALTQIKKHFESQERVYLLEAHLSAAEYKDVISKAELCVAARTHVAIAAYSSCVPTLAIGYSTKAKGIALDLGMPDYVVDVEDSNVKENLLKVFRLLYANRKKLKEQLQSEIPQYKEQTLPAMVEKFLKGKGDCQ